MTGSLLGAMEPVSATVFAALWLGTSFTGYDWAGFLLMVSMILLVSRSGREGKVYRAQVAHIFAIRRPVSSVISTV